MGTSSSRGNSIDRQMTGGSMKEQADKSISRRSMLKRIGSGAAAAWSAPVLTSLRTPAFGQGSPVCAAGCPQCRFGEICGPGEEDGRRCGCVAVPDCFCSDLGFCRGGTPTCTTDADCEPFTGPGSRCAPCVFSEGCFGGTSCWSPCRSGPQAPAPDLPGSHVLRPSR